MSQEQAMCPECGHPTSMKSKPDNNKRGCGCALVVVAILSLAIPPVGLTIGVIIFAIGMYLMISARKGDKSIPYCSNCGWEGK